MSQSTLDLLGRRGRALGQCANFASDHREAPSGVSRARSFHTGIQRKQIRLESDLVDDADDLRNPPCRLLDLIHRTDGAMHDLSALLGIGLGSGDDGVGFDRTSAVRRTAAVI